MGFLDNVENDLKALEKQQERDPEQIRRERARRDLEQIANRAAAPYFEQLKNGNFTKELLDHAVRIGHALRIKVHMTWLGTVLRLQARERRLELMPTPEGVTARFCEGDEETHREKLDLNGNARELAEKWLEGFAGRSDSSTS